jgi:hypothetical protein
MSDRELSINVAYGVSLIAFASTAIWLLGFVVGVFH